MAVNCDWFRFLLIGSKSMDTLNSSSLFGVELEGLSGENNKSLRFVPMPMFGLDMNDSN